MRLSALLSIRGMHLRNSAVWLLGRHPEKELDDEDYLDGYFEQRRNHLLRFGCITWGSIYANCCVELPHGELGELVSS